LLLNATKDRRIKKKMQRRIRQLEANYRRRTSNLSFATLAFNLSLFDLFSSNSPSSFNSSSSNLFAFVLTNGDLLARDLWTSSQVDSNELLIDNS